MSRENIVSLEKLVSSLQGVACSPSPYRYPEERWADSWRNWSLNTRPGAVLKLHEERERNVYIRMNKLVYNYVHTMVGSLDLHWIAVVSSGHLERKVIVCYFNGVSSGLLRCSL